jgi:hypothetical protein
MELKCVEQKCNTILYVLAREAFKMIRVSISEVFTARRRAQTSAAGWFLQKLIQSRFYYGTLGGIDQIHLVDIRINAGDHVSFVPQARSGDTSDIAIPKVVTFMKFCF